MDGSTSVTLTTYDHGGEVVATVVVRSSPGRFQRLYDEAGWTISLDSCSPLPLEVHLLAVGLDLSLERTGKVAAARVRRSGHVVEQDLHGCELSIVERGVVATTGSNGQSSNPIPVSLCEPTWMKPPRPTPDHWSSTTFHSSPSTSLTRRPPLATIRPLYPASTLRLQRQS
jgi:hypothetical protein